MEACLTLKGPKVVACAGLLPKGAGPEADVGARGSWWRAEPAGCAAQRGGWSLRPCSEGGPGNEASADKTGGAAR